MAPDNDRELGLSPEIARLSAQLARDPRSKLFIPLAEEYLKSDMPEEAIMTLEEGLKVHPAYMSARVLLGKAHLMLGEMDKACEQFENVIKAVPDNLYALRKLGEIYLAQAKSDEALKNFRILAILSPKDEELNAIISQLEAGNLPPSPLEMPARKEAGPTAEDVPSLQPAAGIPAKVTPVEEASLKEAGKEQGTAEEEELEGAAPVYEIEEDTGGTGFGIDETEIPEETPAEAHELGENIPLPEKEEPSPFDIGSDVPEPQPLGMEEPEAGEAPQEDEGVFGLGLDEAAGHLTEEPDAEDVFPPAAGEGGGLQDIFAPYGGDKEVEQEAGEQGVYELEEPSDLDLEELGVKMSPSSVNQHAEPSLEMAFDVEAEPETSMFSGEVFGIDTGEEEGGLFFEEQEGAAEEAHEDMPFEFAVDEEASPVEETFGRHEPFGTDEDEEALPFGAEEDLGFEAAPELEAEPGVEPFPDAYDLGMGDEPSQVETEQVHEPVEADRGGSQPHENEPIKTGTLAEMYIRQGFYDRAIDIYKEMIREAPGDMSLKQKLEELYMLADMDSARSASEKVQEEPPVIEPADFVFEKGQGEEMPETAELAPAAPVQSAHDTQVDRDVVEKLERFLDNIRRRGRQ